MSADDRPALSAIDLWATLALACTTSVTVVTLGRAFVDWDYLRPMLLLALGLHAAALLLRALRVAGWVAVPALLVAAGWALAFAYYGTTVHGVLPGGETLHAFVADVRGVLELFPTAVAPVPSSSAFAAPTAAAVLVAVVLADTFAFRAGGHSEAVVPLGAFVVVMAAIGTPMWRIGLTVVWSATALLAVGILRARTQRRRGAWMGARPVPTVQVVLRLATVVVVATLVGLVVGPRLPGTDAEALVDTDQQPSNVTEVVSPLVDIRSELVSSGRTLLFTVRSDDGPHYWRLLSLPTFDGTAWNPPEEDLGDPEIDPPAGTTSISTQRFTIAALGGPMVPAAYRPTRVDSDDDVFWAPDSESLVMPGRGLVEGTVVDVVSAVPRPDPAALRAATASGAPSAEYLEVPASVSTGVADAASMVAVDATSDFDRALALQQWFRTSFTYSTDITFGSSSNAIDEFLRERRGFCQQFAGTFAVMARTLGMPARVAVGFTPGDSTDGTTFRVFGRHAHAWPEVWFAGIGWVAFEPTPGRGSPDGAGYLGVPPEQSDGPDAATPTTTTEPRPDQSTTTTSTLPPASSATTTTVAGGASGRAPSGSALLVVLVLAGVVGWAVAAPRLVTRHVSRRRRLAPPRDRVVHSWYRAVTMIERAGGPSTEGRTAREFAEAVASSSPADAGDLAALADAVDHVVYSRDSADEHLADLADERSHRVVSRQRDRLGWTQRVILRGAPWLEWRLPRARPVHDDT